MRLMLPILAAALAAAPASAAITWSWSFATESGTFVTDGNLVGGVAAPGVYTLIDFSVTASAVGATIGSLSGGDYGDGDPFATFLPYAMAWDGAKVTLWDSDGFNLFDWWVFNDFAGPGYYFFAWDTGNVNDPDRAAYWTGSDFNLAAIGNVSVRPIDGNGGGVIPEPATWAMLIAGFGIIGGALRRRRSAVPAA